jgi:hypothetical protein
MAEKKFLVDLNLNGNKAKNFRLEDYADNSAPTSNFVGRMIYTTNSTNPDRVEVYNGSAWKTLAFTDDVPSVSISLSAPDLFTVSGSPAAYNGTLDFEWNTAAVNTVLAGPGTGSTSSIPTFRSLVDADIPVEIARVEDVNTSLDEYILLTEKGEPSGVAELDENGKVPAEQLGLENYVTLTGEQTLSGKSISDSLTFTNVTSGGNGFVYTDDFGKLVVSTPSTLYLEGNNSVILTSPGGQYLNSVDPDNQIATIGDINSEGVNSIIGTTDQITVSGDGTGDVTLSLPNTVILGTDGNKGRLLVGNANYAEAGSFGIDNSNLLTISSDYGDIFLAPASGSTAYLGGLGSSNQIATIGDLEALDAYDITATQISNWDTAYGWGDHAVEGYLTSAVQDISNTDGNITFSSSTGSVTADLASSIATDTVRAYYFTARSSSASLFDDSPLDITIGTGSGTANIGIGSATSTVTINNDLVVQGDLTVNGDVTTLNTATMNVEDNIFVLNSNVTGTPSVDAGIEVERGTSTNASLIWSESDDIWTAGLAGSEIAIARKFVTTTTGTTHTITHGLATSDVTVNCWLDGEQVEAGIVVTDSNTVTVTTNSSVTNLKTVVVG